MDEFWRSRRRELARLQLQLDEAKSLLDEFERRSLHKRTASELFAIGRLPNLTGENVEDRFAARVATGMLKIRQGQSHGNKS